MRVILQLRECNDSTIKLLTDDLEANYSANAGEARFAAIKEKHPHYSPEEMYQANQDPGRKAALLCRFIYDVPDDEMYPWQRQRDSGQLVIDPSPVGVPLRLRGMYGSPKEIYRSSFKHGRRRHQARAHGGLSSGPGRRQCGSSEED
ncbi:MAG: hypothetical protein ACR2HJ_09300 [Fimbriimonadales bacterium]